MNVYIIPYGPVTDLFQEIEFDIPENSDINELITRLTQQYPDLKKIPFRVAVNGIIQDNTRLNKNDKVALLPPFSGG